MEPSEGDLTPHPTEDINKQINELGSTSIESIATKVISVPRVSVFGEADHTLRPRGLEMINQAKASSVPPTHFVMELPGNDQEVIDKYLSGEINTPGLQVKMQGLRESELDILNYAKEKGIKVIAGDMTIEEMDEWLKAHADIVKNVKQTTGNPAQTAVVLAVLMEKERSFVTGRKIKAVLSDNADAEVWVNCGALHVPNILRGIYGLDQTEPTESSAKATTPPLNTPSERESGETKPPADKNLSVVDSNPFAIVAKKAETDPDLLKLKETLDELLHTPVASNSHLIQIQRAIEILDSSKGKLSDIERASIYLGLSYRYASTSSSDQRPLVNRVMDSVDALNLDPNQKLQGLSKILSGTNLYQTELLHDILTRINSYIPDADSAQLLTQLHSTLGYISDDLSEELQARIQSRLHQLK